MTGSLKVAVMVLMYINSLLLLPLEFSKLPRSPFMHTGALSCPTCLMECGDMTFPYYQFSIAYYLMVPTQHSLKRKAPIGTTWMLWPVDSTGLRKEWVNLKICQRNFLNICAKIFLREWKKSEYPRTVRQWQKMWYMCNRDTRSRRKREISRRNVWSNAGRVFFKLITDKEPHIQEAQRTNTPRPLYSNCRESRQKILKEARSRGCGGKHITFRGPRTRITSDFSSETMQARWECNVIFEVLNKGRKLPT